MKHYSYDDWCKYVKDELEESVRTAYEDHLYTCEECFERYLIAVEENKEELPLLSSEKQFTDKVMAVIAEEKKKGVQETNGTPFYQKAIFHYLIAAGMTILLMTTGVFQEITKFGDAAQHVSVHEKSTSFTNVWMNKTITLLDEIEMKIKEGNK